VCGSVPHLPTSQSKAFGNGNVTRPGHAEPGWPVNVHTYDTLQCGNGRPASNRPFSDTDEALMQAMSRALSEHGSAELTIRRTAEEYGKSTAAIHYHYETEADLLAAVLDSLLDQFIDAVHQVETTDPTRRLALLLDRLLVDPADHPTLLVAMLGMRSRAPHEEASAERFQQNDEYVRYLLRTVIDHGAARVCSGRTPTPNTLPARS